MRILFLSHYFPPEVNAPATRTYEHCVRWAQAGHDVTVVTCVPNCPDGRVFDGYKNRFRRQVEEMDGIRIIRIWTYLAPNAGTLRRILNYVSFWFSASIASFRIRRPDIVVATSPQFFNGWAGVFVSRFKRRPLLLEIRDIWPESIQAVGALNDRRLLWLLEKMERSMYRAATHIVAVGKGYRDNILSKADVADRISVITNGVDLGRFAPQEPDDALRKGWGLKGRFVCSYIGTLGMAHGLEVVLGAAKLLKDKNRHDIGFLLVGDGAYRAQLEQQAKDAGLTDMVVFTGRQPKQAMPAILAGSDACLIHLRGCELFGTVIPSKIFETMAMARPIVMGVRGEASQIVMRAQAGIEMVPDSAASLVAAVEQLADDLPRARQLGTSGRDYVATHYDRDTLATEFLELMKNIVSPKKERQD